MIRLLFLLAVWLVGCSAPGPTPPASSGSPKTRVAVVLPSAVDDLAWSQSMVDSLNALKQKDPSLEVAISDKMVSVADANAALRDYADEGYDLVVAHGTQYGNGLFEVAADFPEVSFAYGTATDTRGARNVFAYDAAADQAGFVNGVLAAGLSQKGVLGVVGPVEAGDAKLYIDGFQAGARASRPDVKVLVAYTGSFSDTSQAAETASVQVQAGADVLTGSAQQVAGAINVAREKKLYWVGTQANQASLAPEQVVVCQTYDWTPVLQDILNERRQGRPGGKQYRLTFGNGLVSVFNPQVPVPEKVRASYDKALREQK